MITKTFEDPIIPLARAGVLKKFPLLGSVMSGVKFIPVPQIQTAATDGVRVFYNPDHFKEISHEDRVVLFAHELMHIAFDHIPRGVGKNRELWNISTDAVINQIIKNEGLELLDYLIDMPEAINMSAQELYNQLVSKTNDNNEGKSNDDEPESGTDNNSNIENHDFWQGDPNEQGDDDNNKDDSESDGSGENHSENMGDNQDDESDQGNKNRDNSAGQDDKSDLEKSFSTKNSKAKQQLGEKIKKSMREASEAGMISGGNNLSLGLVGYSQPKLSWKRILKREFEKEEERWSYRRANEDNYYQARVGSFDEYDKARTEILIDTSSSVNENLLRSFLREVKGIIKDSDIFVGCFDTAFYGFTEIKSAKDIDSYKLRGRGGTNFNVALKSFSNDKAVNKIIFTDGEATVAENTYNMSISNLMWLIWGNAKFNPCVGKVIRVDKKTLEKNEENEM